MDLIFAKSAAKHQIPKSGVLKIINEKSGTKIGVSREGLDKLAWIGLVDFHQMVEIIAIDFVRYFYVIHVMPIKKRGVIKDDQMEGLW